MNIYYSPAYNIDLGLFNKLHPFDGKKFSKVHDAISRVPGLGLREPSSAVPDSWIEGFVSALMRRSIRNKRTVLAALEVPYIPLLPFSVIDKRILLPMRWGVSGTIEAARDALSGNHTWNLSGGYHHASRQSAEGFCIYNDIGMAVQRLTDEGLLAADDRILIVDVDAHHGNGNAHVFMDQRQVVILDIYNGSIYPSGQWTKQRLDINIPLAPRTPGADYLAKLSEGLQQIRGPFRLAFVVAGTDVLSSDPLGGLGLSIDDCVARDQLVLERLQALSVPAVFVGGGGYGRDSAKAIVASIRNLHEY